MSFFVVPIEIVTHPKYGLQPEPKYLPALGVDLSICKFGLTAGDPCIVWANTSPAQDATLAAISDVLLIPPLDNTVPAGQLTAVRNVIETFAVPSHWVQAGMQYRSILRVMVGMANLMQRMRGLGQPTKLAGNLDRQISSFSAAIRNALAQAADDLAIDRSNVGATTTLREALRIAGEQMAQRRMLLGPGEI